MKLTSKHIDKDGAGQVTILPEETEDMWHIYNILQLNDRLKATAVRYTSFTLSLTSVPNAKG